MGNDGYTAALSLLTEAAVNDGLLTEQALGRYADELRSASSADDLSIGDMLYLLEHDGYLERQAVDYRFVSGLLEVWWRARHGQFFTPIAER